jgi:hypothetical protein|nr:MAG TPA: hypothetical protein [Caudoviricetes sp.]
MTDILLQLVEALRMASELPIVAAIPLYGIAYCGFAYVLIVVLARLRRLIKEW